MNYNNLIVRNNLHESYSDIHKPEAVSVLSLFARFNRDIKEVMVFRIKRKAVRQQQIKRIKFLDSESFIPRTGIKVQDVRDGNFDGADALLSGADGWMFDGNGSKNAS